MCMDSKLKQVTNVVTKGAQTILGNKLQRIILYGSYARGDYTVESDVDIMVLADFSDDERRLCQKMLNKVASDVSLECDVTVSIMLRTPEVFTMRIEYVPFYRNVHSEGVEIYAT